MTDNRFILSMVTWYGQHRSLSTAGNIGVVGCELDEHVSLRTHESHAGIECTSGDRRHQRSRRIHTVVEADEIVTILGAKVQGDQPNQLHA